MHYKNGREAKENDPVIWKDNWAGAKVMAGTLHSLMPGSTSCNAQLAVPLPGGVKDYCVTVGNCYHAEDALNALEPLIDELALHGYPAETPAPVPSEPGTPPQAPPDYPAEVGQA